MGNIIFIDCEIKNKKIVDIGAVKENDTIYSGSSVTDFTKFIAKADYLVGHNVIDFDSKYLELCFPKNVQIIDTLYVSPILFPKKPYHKLVKNDKLRNTDNNNPVSDSKKCRDLFYEEKAAFDLLEEGMQNIYGDLLASSKYYSAFFNYVGYKKPGMFSRRNVKNEIVKRFSKLICHSVDLDDLIKNYPIELAYSLALISVDDRESKIPGWVHHNFPNVDFVLKKLRQTPCFKCDYCNGKFDSKKRLKEFFGFDNFRKYGDNNDENLQEEAVNSSIKGESQLVIFPTGGGKSLTYQLPALISGDTYKALTIVISPLQSLMKDQVDNLESKGIIDSVTICGILSPIERSEAVEKIKNGIATILYIAPESLRSKTIEKLLLERTIDRFVIDEAHCFSSWGQDFRVDYQYIGKFIRDLEEKKGGNIHIPVSCFTATAKQKVVSDIQDYFKNELNLNLKLFATSSTRKNLQYKVIKMNSDEDKYSKLRELIQEHDCPSIVYVSSVKKTVELAKRLTEDGYVSLPYNGKMESSLKKETQDKFKSNEVRIIVATSAFGMGVDKGDVRLVVHFEISDSLENYVQEAGRAGRDLSLSNCYVLFNEHDLDAHFRLLNASKLTMNEIQSVWKAIKDLTKTRQSISCSALEIANKAGFDVNSMDIETKVRTAINSLEKSGYLVRGQNSPRVFATGILTKNLMEANDRIDKNPLLSSENKETAKRIMSYLISAKNSKMSPENDGESRVDYVADSLGLEKHVVVDIVSLLKEMGILADSQDMNCFIKLSEKRRNETKLKGYLALEEFLFNELPDGPLLIDLKQITDKAVRSSLKEANPKNIKSILSLWATRGYIKKVISSTDKYYNFEPLMEKERMKEKMAINKELSLFAFNYMYDNDNMQTLSESSIIQFSILELFYKYKNQNTLIELKNITQKDIEHSLLFLTRLKVLDIEGGFLVLYNAMTIRRIITNNNIKYKIDDYKLLDEYYSLKSQQIHIVGEYANMMTQDYDSAQMFVKDYFGMEYKSFLRKYFKGREDVIKRNITSSTYENLFASLSDKQMEIIDDSKAKYISVIAGPGSGKTRVLVHKLASLLLLEDVKQEQLLMLTFSRHAAMEFKSKLYDLIGSAASFVEIKTFHSFAFDLLGKIALPEELKDVVKCATDMIINGEVEPGRIAKVCLVIDEAQDMSFDEYRLIKVLIEKNDDMRVIAVGDDDQNIYEFRDSSSKYLSQLVSEYGATKYELVQNYRSKKNIVRFANEFAKSISVRLKEENLDPVSNEDGNVSIIKYQTNNMIVPLCNAVISSRNNALKRVKDGLAKTIPSIAVLTQTNEEALLVTGVLTKNNIPCRLIQSDGDVSLQNMVEIRYILKEVLAIEEPIIPLETWKEIRGRTYKYYGESSNYYLIKNMFLTYEKTKDSVIYKTDFIEFLKESSIEDFVTIEKNEVIVSTIHKSKGKEFDVVHILLNNPSITTDEDKRKIFVGVTRAKSQLFIRINNDWLDKYQKLPYVNFAKDEKEYDEPELIQMQLGYHDVSLGTFKNDEKFKDKKTRILRCLPGMSLQYNEEKMFFKTETGTAFFTSRSFQETIRKIQEKGYKFDKATIKFIVSWKDKDHPDEEEWAIVLPSISFVKDNR